MRIQSLRIPQTRCCSTPGIRKTVWNWSVTAKIRTEDLPNTSIERYCYSNPLGLFLVFYFCVMRLGVTAHSVRNHGAAEWRRNCVDWNICTLEMASDFVRRFALCFLKKTNWKASGREVPHYCVEKRNKSLISYINALEDGRCVRLSSWSRQASVLPNAAVGCIELQLFNREVLRSNLCPKVGRLAVFHVLLGCVHKWGVKLRLDRFLPRPSYFIIKCFPCHLSLCT
jgi:hypothetical protein